jgi:hypothetical protein
MRNKGLSFLAAAALLTSVGAAYAKGPVTLTDDQLDKVTAGDAASILNFWYEAYQVETAIFLATVFHIPPYNPAL